MKHLIYIIGFALILGSCSSEENKDDNTEKSKENTESKKKEKETVEESGGSCEYIDMAGKVNTIEYYEELGIVKGLFLAQDSEEQKMLASSHTSDTILYYVQPGDKTQPGSGIRASMTVMVSGSCQPYPYHIKINDGTHRLLVNTDSLNNSTTDLKDK